MNYKPLTILALFALLAIFFVRAHPDPAAVNALEVQAWLWRDTPKGRKPSPQTVRSRYSAIDGLYRAARQWGLATGRPTEGAKLPRYSPPVNRLLTPDDAQRLLAAIQGVLKGHRLAAQREARDRAFIIAGILTGLRVHELASITAGCLSGALSSESGNTYATLRVKGGKRRRIHLPPPAMRAILAMLAARGLSLGTMREDEIVWGAYTARHNGYSDCVWERAIRRYARAAGLGHVTVHSLRRSFATTLYALGTPMKEISALLGHEHEITTERYVLRDVGTENRSWPMLAKLLGLS